MHLGPTEPEKHRKWNHGIMMSLYMCSCQAEVILASTPAQGWEKELISHGCAHKEEVRYSGFREGRGG